MLQESLLCGCGADASPSGLCPRCQRRERLSRENFSGLRTAVLIRDGCACRCCGESNIEMLLVHHRRPSVDEMRFLITLCRRCHVRIHHTWRPRFWFLTWDLLRRLWREANADIAVQLCLPLVAHDTGTVEQGSLFDSQAA
jgi:5-methylcytosine-specific restriction endonuclease McrA